MKCGEAWIDWSTATVKVTSDPRSNWLTVDVAGSPGSHWGTAFKSIAMAHNQRRAGKWGDVSLGAQGGTVVHVDAVRPGAEAELKVQLDRLAKQASEIAIPKEEREEELRAEKHAKAQQQANEATEMQERFRAA